MNLFLPNFGNKLYFSEYELLMVFQQGKPHFVPKLVIFEFGFFKNGLFLKSTHFQNPLRSNIVFENSGVNTDNIQIRLVFLFSEYC
jgi:hypothetical protein